MDVTVKGGLFVSRTLPRRSRDAMRLKALNRRVLKVLGFVRGVTHTEFIKTRKGGRFYFLETAARVGGAYLTDMIEAATGLNLWAEWAKIEIAGGQALYKVPPHRQDYAGIIISLARQEWPDTSGYTDPEIVWRLHKLHHAGLIMVAKDPARVEQLLTSYVPRFYDDFFASQPHLDRPPE
jgi:hypothetical protein